MDKGELESIITDEVSREESESEFSHKSIKKKDAKNETDHEEPLVMDNPFVKDPRYFNIFECGKNLLNRLGATCK